MEYNVTAPKISEYLRILFRGRWIIFMSFLTVVATAAYLTYKMEPEYEASSTVLVAQEDIMEARVFNAPMAYYAQQTHVANQAEIIKSHSLAEEVIQSLETSPYRDELEVMGRGTERKEITLDDRVQRLRKNMSVAKVKDTDILVVTYRAHSGFEAAFLANAISEQYYRSSFQETRGEVTEVRRFLEEQLQDVRVKLSRSEELLKRYKENQKLVALEPETKKLVEQAATFESYYNQAETDLNANLRRLDYLKKQLSETKSTLVEDVTQITSPLIEQLQKDIAERQSRVASLLATPSPGMDITVTALEKEIEQIKKRLIEETRKIASAGIASMDPLATSQDIFNNILATEIEIRSLTARAEALRGIVDSFNAQLETLPEKSLVLARLERDTKLNENLYLMLREKYEETRISEAGKMPGVRIIDKAKPPQKPTRPNRRLNILIGIFLGLGFGIAISFALEFMDDSIKTPEDIEKLKLPLLGTIPAVKIAEVARRLKQEGRPYSVEELDRLESKLVTHFSPRSPVSEAYRSLRTNIQFLGPDHTKKVWLVTSAATREGKSTILANLAIAVAQTGVRVLLIDSDLRHPVLHEFFGLDEARGLADILRGSKTLDQAVKRTDIENLSLITAGELSAGSSELTVSNGLRLLIEEAKSKYDFVLMDSPPLLAVTDAAILASSGADGTLLVVGSGFVSPREISYAVSQLSRGNSSCLGVVLNGLDIKKIYGSYYYYFHYQYHPYYDMEDKKERKRKKIAPADTAT